MIKSLAYLKIFLLLIIGNSIFAQTNCIPQRYVDEIFTAVDKTNGLQYGSADPYGLISNQDLFLDIFEPVGDTLEKRPLVLHQFGGGFLIGWRTEPVIPQMGESYAKRGFVFATIDYRLGFNVLDGQSAERAVYRAAQDLRASLRYLVDNADLYGIDTSRIFLTGTSAGCLSAMVSAYMEDADRVDIPSTYGILLEPSDLGCPNCSGNSNFNNQEVKIDGIINNWGAILDTSYIDTHIDPEDNVPMISFHGTEDVIVPYEQGSPFSLPIFPTVQGSALIHQRMDNLGIKNRLYPLQGLGHEPQLLQLQGWVTDTILQLGSEFVHEIMQPQTSPILGNPTSCLSLEESYMVDFHNNSSYCWEVNGGQIIQQNNNSIIVLWNTLGAGNVAVKEYNEVHAWNTAELEVNVGEMPDTAFSYSSYDGLFTFSNSESNYNNLLWNFGDGVTSATQNVSHQYNNDDINNVVLTIGNDFCTLSNGQQIQSDICPNSGVGIFSFDSTATFSSTAEFADSVYWQLDNGNSFNGLSFETLFENEGTYTITQIVFNDYCTDTLTQSFEIDFCPIIDFEFSILGNEVSFTNISQFEDILFWDFGNNNTTSLENPSFDFGASGSYDVRLIGYNLNGCNDTIVKTIIIQDTTISGINELEKTLKIFPNPFTNYLDFDVKNNSISSVKIFSLQGKEMIKTINSDRINTTHLPKGIYIVEIITNNTFISKKIVKI